MERRVPTVLTITNPPDLAPPVGFAHVASAHGFVWLGGQISSDATGVVLFPGDLVAQFRQSLKNVRTALEAGGCRPNGVVKMTYYVKDLRAYRDALRPLGLAYREVFGTHYPATSLFGVEDLFEPDALIEIECVAIQGDVEVRTGP